MEGTIGALVFWLSLTVVVVELSVAETNTHLQYDNELAKAQNNASKTFLEELLHDIDTRIRPMAIHGHGDLEHGDAGGPVVVAVRIYIISLGEISEVSMDYTLDVYFRMIWSDPRLVFAGKADAPDHLTLPSKFVDQVWTPDLFFPNLKKGYFHDLTVPNKLLKIYPNGTVIYSVRLTLTASCPMELAAFPMDKQTCALKIESYTYEAHELRLVFDDPPVEIDDELELPQFELDERGIHNTTCDKQYDKIGRYSCLKVTFPLYRHFGFFLLQTYIPSVLIIILSWVSFWINMDAVPARISLGVTTVLTMTTQLSGAKTSIPKISYPKAIDVWMSMGMVFVFAALIEYAFINSLSRKQRKLEEIYKKTDENKESMELLPQNAFTDSKGRKVKVNYRNMAARIDKISRYVFPLIFIIFNLVYWPVYTASRT